MWKEPILWLLLITGLTFSRLMWADFAWDDEALIQSNPFLSSLDHGFGLFFTQDLWESCVAQAQVQSGYYRPLVMISWALEHALFCGIDGAHIHSLVPAEMWTQTCTDRFGESTLAIPPVETGAWSGAAHLASLCWHLLATGLLYGLLLRVVDRGPALVGATLFALHPVQTEVLALVAARNDSMAAAFLLGALWVLERKERPRLQGWLAATLLLLAALLSKESALLSPLFLLMLDLGRWKRCGHWSRYLSFVSATAVYLWLRSTADLEGSIWPTEAAQDKLLEQLGSILGVYAKLITWPWPLTPARHVDYLPAASTLLPAGLVLLSLSALALKRGHKPWLVGTGLCWAILALAPSMAATLDKGLLGERYLYLPMAGLSLALAASLRQVPRLPLALVGGVFICLIQTRLPQWQNGRTVWMAAHESQPTPYTAGGLAWYLHRDGTRMGQEGQIAEADLQASLPLLEMALTGSPPYRSACPLGMRAHLEAQDWEGATRLGEHLWENRVCSQMETTIGLQYGEALVSTGQWERSLEVLLKTAAMELLQSPFPAQLHSTGKSETIEARVRLSDSLTWRPGEPLRYWDSVGNVHHTSPDQVDALEITGIMSLNGESLDRPVLIVHEKGPAGTLSAEAWSSAARELGISNQRRLPLDTGLENTSSLIHSLKAEAPNLILMGTQPLLTRHLVRAADQEALARGRGWLSLPGRVQPRQHSAIEGSDALTLMAAAFHGLGETDVVDALARAHPDPARLRVAIHALLLRSNSGLQCQSALLADLETQSPDKTLKHCLELLQTGACDFRTPVLEYATRAHVRQGNWEGALMSSLGNALMRRLDTFPGGIDTARGKRTVMIQRPDGLESLWTQLWRAMQQDQGLVGLGRLSWSDKQARDILSELQRVRPDLIILAMLPQDASQLRPALQAILPQTTVMEIPTIGEEGERRRPMDEPGLVAVGAWLMHQGRNDELGALLLQTEAPLLFKHAMEGLAVESQQVPLEAEATPQ